jgi:hypothetical protein
VLCFSSDYHSRWSKEIFAGSHEQFSRGKACEGYEQKVP